MFEREPPASMLVRNGATQSARLAIAEALSASFALFIGSWILHRSPGRGRCLEVMDSPLPDPLYRVC